MADKKKKVAVESPIKKKKKRKAKPGSKAYKEVKLYQKGTGNLIPRAAVKRIIRSIMKEHVGEPKMTKELIDLIQWDAELFVCGVLRATKERAELSGRKTCTAKHLADVINQRHYIGCLEPADMENLA